MFREFEKYVPEALKVYCDFYVQSYKGDENKGTFAAFEKNLKDELPFIISNTMIEDDIVWKQGDDIAAYFHKKLRALIKKDPDILSTAKSLELFKKMMSGLPMELQHFITPAKDWKDLRYNMTIGCKRYLDRIHADIMVSDVEKKFREVCLANEKAREIAKLYPDLKSIEMPIPSAPSEPLTPMKNSDDKMTYAEAVSKNIGESNQNQSKKLNPVLMVNDFSGRVELAEDPEKKENIMLVTGRPSNQNYSNYNPKPYNKGYGSKNNYSSSNFRGQKGRGYNNNRFNNGYKNSRNNNPKYNHKKFRYQNRNNDNRNRNCYTCGKPGHIARDCRSEVPNNNHGGEPKPNTCERCGYFGHSAKDCMVDLTKNDQRNN